MNLDAVLGDDAQLRESALSMATGAPEHLRSAFATKLAAVANEAAEALAAAEETGAHTEPYATQLARACGALALLGVGVAKTCLLRMADEGTPAVKVTLARALRGTTTPEGRAVLVYLLSDEDVEADALRAIAVTPWPEVLPHLMEVAEGDDRMARLALKAIARCGASGSSKERYAAADFLLEQLEDDALLHAALDALLRFGAAFPGVSDRAKALAQQTGERRIAGLCLLAASTPHGLVELAAVATSDEGKALAFLARLLQDTDPRVRAPAEETSRVLGFG